MPLLVKRTFRNMVIHAGIVLVLSYLVILLFVYLRQDRMLYFPARDLWQVPSDRGIAYEDLSLTTRDGLRISAWYLPAPHERGVLLFCHGNAGNMADRMDSLMIFHDLDLSVLIFDYRGYGKSGGKPSESGTYRDAEAAWDYLMRVKQIPPHRIVIFGRSLGGAVAAELAREKNPAALIIESTFLSVPDLGARLYPWLPVRLLSKFRYATVDKIGSISCPKLVIHSPDDEIIPFDQGRTLYEKSSPPKEFLMIRGGHNEGFLISGSLYRNGLKAFLEKWLNR